MKGEDIIKLVEHDFEYYEEEFKDNKIMFNGLKHDVLGTGCVGALKGKILVDKASLLEEKNNLEDFLAQNPEDRFYQGWFEGELHKVKQLLGETE